MNYYNANEKRNMKKYTAALSGSVGIFMFVTLALSYVLNMLYTGALAAFTAKGHVLSEFVSHIFGITLVESAIVVNNFLSSGVVDELFTLVSLVVCLFLPAYVLGKMWGLDVSECFVIKGKLVKGFVFTYAFAQLVMLCMTNIADCMWTFLFPSASGDALQSRGYTSDNLYVLAVVFLCTCIAVPVIEEYVFRGVVFGVFRKAGTSFAVVASAVCFGLMHGSVLQCMYATAFGLISAMLVVVTKNIKTSVIFHMLNNIVSFLSIVIPLRFGQSAVDVFNSVHILFVLSFSFYGMYLFFARDGILACFREKTEPDFDIQNGAKLSGLFSLPVIIFVALFAVKCVLGEL